MAAKISPTLKVLHELRGDIRALTHRVDAVEAALTGRVDALESVMKGLAPAVFETLRLMQGRDEVRARVDDHERRLTKLERRVR